MLLRLRRSRPEKHPRIRYKVRECLRRLPEQMTANEVHGCSLRTHYGYQGVCADYGERADQTSLSAPAGSRVPAGANKSRCALRALVVTESCTVGTVAEAVAGHGRQVRTADAVEATSPCTDVSFVARRLVSPTGSGPVSTADGSPAV